MNMKKPIAAGVLGSSGLIVFYLSILTIAESFQHALSQFASMWFWISLLVIGFGIQLGLFVLMRELRKSKSAGATAEVAATGGMSAGAMVACCAHHVADLLPVLGLSAAAVFLTRYQLPFILLGVFSNLVGIVIMLAVMQKHNLYPHERFFSRLFRYNMKFFRTVIASLSAAAVASAFLFTAVNAVADDGELSIPELSTKVNDKNYVTIEVTPIDFQFGQPLRFEIYVNTHQGDLNFDLTEISMLKGVGEEPMLPVSWEGSPPGGHHRNGTLVFPPVPSTVREIQLIIKDVYDIPERSFEWKLQ